MPTINPNDVTLTQGQKYYDPKTGQDIGTVQYSAETGQKLGLGQTTTQNITPQSLTRTPPLELPKTPVSTAISAAQGALEAGAEQATSALDQYQIEQNKQTKENVSAEQKSLKDKFNELAGIPQQQADLEREADIAGKLKEQNEARAAKQSNNNLLIQEQRALLKRREAIFSSGSLTTGQAEAQYNAEARQSLSKQADISLNGLLLEARFENATFDLNSAQSIVQHKIDVMTEGLKQKLEFDKFFLERNEDKLTTSEKRIFDQMQTEDQRKYDTTKSELESVHDTYLKAVEGGAPTNVAQLILKAKTSTEALGLAGNYLRKPVSPVAGGKITAVPISKITAGVDGGINEAVPYYSQLLAEGKISLANVPQSIRNSVVSYSQGDINKPLAETAIKEISQTESAVANLNVLKGVIQQNLQFVGPISGLARFNPYSKARQVQAEIDRVRQTVGKALEGGVLRKEDEEKYKKILATLADTPETAIYKIESLISALGRDVSIYKANQLSAGRFVKGQTTTKPEDLRAKYNY